MCCLNKFKLTHSQCNEQNIQHRKPYLKKKSFKQHIWQHQNYTWNRITVIITTQEATRWLKIHTHQITCLKHDSSKTRNALKTLCHSYSMCVCVSLYMFNWHVTYSMYVIFYLKMLLGTGCIFNNQWRCHLNYTWNITKKPNWNITTETKNL